MTYAKRSNTTVITDTPLSFCIEGHWRYSLFWHDIRSLVVLCSGYVQLIVPRRVVIDQSHIGHWYRRRIWVVGLYLCVYVIRDDQLTESPTQKWKSRSDLTEKDEKQHGPTDDTLHRWEETNSDIGEIWMFEKRRKDCILQVVLCHKWVSKSRGREQLSIEWQLGIRDDGYVPQPIHSKRLIRVWFIITDKVWGKGNT